MLISFVIPAYNASGTIGKALESVFNAQLQQGLRVEAVVVDDGSQDSVTLAEVVSRFPGATLVIHDCNRGMCAGRNTGIKASAGDVVTILDSDDELVPDWPLVFEDVYREWPEDCQVCYAACENPEGVVTAQEPDFKGMLTIDDILNERHSGEYLPLFRGQYVRRKLYVDLGLRKSCGIVSYITFALDGPIWVTNRVLRIYHEARVGSVTHGWTSPAKAAETARCYQALLQRYGDLYLRQAPKVYRTKLLRLSVYLRLCGMPGYWRAWLQGASLSAVRETLGAAFVLAVGASLGARIVLAIKRIGLVRRYG